MTAAIPRQPCRCQAISVQARQQKERCVMRIQPRILIVTALVAGVFTQLPGPGAAQTRAAFAAPAGGDAVTVWNANAGVAATKACIAPLDDPFHESRIYAMMHVAIHDALNAIDRRFRPYTFDKQVEPGASPDAAVAAAARDVLVPLLGQLPRLDSSPSRASMQALQVSKPPTPRPLPPSPTLRPRRRVSPWDRPRRRRSSP